MNKDFSDITPKFDNKSFDIVEVQQESWMKASKLTGEMLPFVTPYSAEPDKGVEISGEDTCHTEEYVPIQDVMRKYLRDGMPDLSDEYMYSEDELSFNDTPADAFDEDDPIERQIQLEEYADRHPAETHESVSAAVQAQEEAEKGTTQGESAEAPVITGDGEA